MVKTFGKVQTLITVPVKYSLSSQVRGADSLIFSYSGEEKMNFNVDAIRYI